MLSMIIVGCVFVAGIIVFAILKPNGARIFLGFFYIVMGLAVNMPLAIINASIYLEMANGAFWPFYRDLFQGILSINPALFIILVALFQISMGLLILNRKNAVKAGLIGTSLFVLAITPFGFHQLPWLGLPAIQIYLLTKTFDKNFFDIIRHKNNQTPEPVL